MTTSRLRLGQLLVDARLITPEALEDVLAAQRQDGRRLGVLLVERGHISEVQLTQILSHQLSIPWVTLLKIEFSRQLLNLVSRELAEQYCLLPIYVRRVRSQGDTLYIAMDDPTNEEALRACSAHAGLSVRPMIAPPSDIRSAIRAYYGGASASTLPPPATVAVPVLAEAPAPVAAAAPAPVVAAAPAPVVAAAPAAVAAAAPGAPAVAEQAAAPAEPAIERPGGARPRTLRSALFTEPGPSVRIRALEPEPEAPAAATERPAEPSPRPGEPVAGATAERVTPAPVEQLTPAPAERLTPAPVERLPPAPDERLTPTPDERPAPIPSPRGRAPRMVSLTLLDGTTLTLPARPAAGRARPATAVKAPEPEPAHEAPASLTARDLVAALRAVADGADASAILGDDVRWESMFAALLSVLLKKHVIADWEFVEELNKLQKR